MPFFAQRAKFGRFTGARQLMTVYLYEDGDHSADSRLFNASVEKFIVGQDPDLRLKTINFDRSTHTLVKSKAIQDLAALEERLLPKKVLRFSNMPDTGLFKSDETSKTKMFAGDYQVDLELPF
jgi:hypothetical protein